MSLDAFHENLRRECAAAVLGGEAVCPRYRLPQWVCAALGVFTSAMRQDLALSAHWHARWLGTSLPKCPHAVENEFWYEREDREAARRARKAAAFARKHSMLTATYAVNIAEDRRAAAEGYRRATLGTRHTTSVRYFWTGKSRRGKPRREAYVLEQAP